MCLRFKIFLEEQEGVNEPKTVFWVILFTVDLRRYRKIRLFNKWGYRTCRLSEYSYAPFSAHKTNQHNNNKKKKLWYDCQWDNYPQETKWHRNKQL